MRMVLPPGVRTSKQEWPYQVNVVSRSSPIVRHLRVPVDASHAATLGAVPATQIAQNLAFINWTVLTGLALGVLRGGRPAPPADRRRRRGYLALHDGLRRRVRAPGLALRRRPADARSATRRSSSTRPGTRPRRAALGRVLRCSPRPRSSSAASRPAVGAARSSSAALGGRRRRRSSSARWPGAAASLGIAGAARPAGRRQRGDRRRLRRDDPRPLVPRDAEAARGAAHPAVARPARRRRRSRSSCSSCWIATGAGPADVGAVRRRSSGRGRCSSGCA